MCLETVGTVGKGGDAVTIIDPTINFFFHFRHLFWNTLLQCMMRLIILLGYLNILLKYISLFHSEWG